MSSLSRIALLGCTKRAILFGCKNLVAHSKQPATINLKRSLFVSSSHLNRYFTKDHEWITVKDGTGTIGVTDYAQDKLGELVYCELPDVGQTFEQEDCIGAVESVKAASDVYAPVSGEIIEVNNELASSPSLVNKSPMEEGWIAKIKLSDVTELEGLMNEEQYEKHKSEEE